MILIALDIPFRGLNELRKADPITRCDQGKYALIYLPIIWCIQLEERDDLEEKVR